MNNHRYYITFILLFFTLKNNLIAQQHEDAKASTSARTYPCVEVYSEIDKGRPNAGNDKWTDPNGRTVYGGARDYKPFILCKRYSITDEQVMELMQVKLKYLPYFAPQKPSITLGQYFNALQEKNRSLLYNILPENLNLLKAEQLKGDGYTYFSTMLVYQDSRPSSITVIWLNEDAWYVDETYYQIDSPIEQWLVSPKEELVAEGSLDDFLRFSPLFQHKLHEGFSHLKLNQKQVVVPLDEPVIIYALSPGMPNTHSYHIEIYGDGSYKNGSVKSKQKMEPNKLTSILMAANRLGIDYYQQSKPEPLAYDKQQLTIKIWSKSRLYTLTNYALDDPSQPLTQFTTVLKKELGIQ